MNGKEREQQLQDSNQKFSDAEILSGIRSIDYLKFGVLESPAEPVTWEVDSTKQNVLELLAEKALAGASISPEQIQGIKESDIPSEHKDLLLTYLQPNGERAPQKPHYFGNLAWEDIPNHFDRVPKGLVESMDESQRAQYLPYLDQQMKPMNQLVLFMENGLSGKMDLPAHLTKLDLLVEYIDSAFQIRGLEPTGITHMSHVSIETGNYWLKDLVFDKSAESDSLMPLKSVLVHLSPASGQPGGDIFVRPSEISYALMPDEHKPHFSKEQFNNAVDAVIGMNQNQAVQVGMATLSDLQASGKCISESQKTHILNSGELSSQSKIVLLTFLNDGNPHKTLIDHMKEVLQTNKTALSTVHGNDKTNIQSKGHSL